MDPWSEQILTAALLIYSIAVGFAIVEWLKRTMTRIRVASRLSKLQATLRAFHAAGNDEARQSLILQAGLHTLTLSLLLFVALAIACLAMALPLLWIRVTTFELTFYMLALSTTAVTWWRIRYARG